MEDIFCVVILVNLCITGINSLIGSLFAADEFFTFEVMDVAQKIVKQVLLFFFEHWRSRNRV